MPDAQRLEAILELKDEFSDKMEAIAEKAKAFKKYSEKIKPVIEANDKASAKIKKVSAVLKKIKSIKNVDLTAKDKATKTVLKLKANLMKLKAKAIALKVKDMASKVVGKIGNKLSQIVKKRWEARVGVKDGASSVLNKLTKMLAVLGAGVVIKTALQKGSELEQQQVSMEHFMGVGNKGKSKGDIHKMTNSYMKDLRKNANETPFETGDVVSAGTRALTITQGKAGEAKRLVKLAEDMAASDPNKSLGDAIEAIADAKMGEFERMKEFGFKGSKAEFDKAGGDFFKMKSQDGRTLNETFGGLSGKLSNTSSGMVSTITGVAKTGLQDTGAGILEGIKPSLAKVRDEIVRTFGDVDFNQVGQRIGQSLNKVFDFAQKIGSAIKSAFEMFSGGFNWMGGFEGLAQTLAPVAELFERIFGGITNKAPIAQAIFSGLGVVIGAVAGVIAQVLSILAQVILAVFDGIKAAINTAKSVIHSLGQKYESVKSTIESAVNSIGQFVSKIMGNIKSAIEGAKKVIHGLGEAWKNLKKKIESNPIVQSITQVFSGDGGGGSGKTSAFGTRRVPKNDYPMRLHEGERVLTKNEANRLDSDSGMVVNITIKDTIVREEADIDLIVEKLVKRIKVAKAGGVINGSMA